MVGIHQSIDCRLVGERLLLSMVCVAAEVNLVFENLCYSPDMQGQMPALDLGGPVHDCMRCLLNRFSLFFVLDPPHPPTPMFSVLVILVIFI